MGMEGRREVVMLVVYCGGKKSSSGVDGCAKRLDLNQL